MYTTDGHIIIALTVGHRAPCLHHTPSPDSRHRATECATVDAEQTCKADTHGGGTGRESEARAPGAAGAGTGSEAEPESVGGDAGQIGQAWQRWDRPRQAEPPADRQSHAEPPRMPQRVQLTTADADGAQRGTESRRRGFSCAV